MKQKILPTKMDIEFVKFAILTLLFGENFKNGKTWNKKGNLKPKQN